MIFCLIVILSSVQHETLHAHGFWVLRIVVALEEWKKKQLENINSVTSAAMGTNHIQEIYLSGQQNITKTHQNITKIFYSLDEAHQFDFS